MGLGETRKEGEGKRWSALPNVGEGRMTVGKGMFKWLFKLEKGSVVRTLRRDHFQKLGVIDKAEGAVVVLQLFAMQVLVSSISFAGGMWLVLLQ